MSVIHLTSATIKSCLPPTYIRKVKVWVLGGYFFFFFLVPSTSFIFLMYFTSLDLAHVILAFILMVHPGQGQTPPASGYDTL